MEKIFFDSWESIVRTFLIGIFSYGGLVLMLRVVGNRTLSQLNAFDFIVTVALGSTLATVILSKDVALADGILALALLIALQLLISRASVSSKAFRSIIKTRPFLLFFKGNFLQDALDRHRITEDEVLQIVRSMGIANLGDVDAIILETNGKFSVIKNIGGQKGSTIQNVDVAFSKYQSDSKI